MSYKAYSVAQALADELTKRIPTLGPVVVGADTNGDTTITMGDGTVGDKNAFIRVIALPNSLATNIVGLPQESYTPSVVQFATEANAAAGAGADILTPTELLPLIGCLVNTAARVDWYVSTNGTAPTVATITGTPSASFDSSLYGGMRASQ